MTRVSMGIHDDQLLDASRKNCSQIGHATIIVGKMKHWLPSAEHAPGLELPQQEAKRDKSCTSHQLFVLLHWGVMTLQLLFPWPVSCMHGMDVSSRMKHSKSSSCADRAYCADEASISSLFTAGHPQQERFADFLIRGRFSSKAKMNCILMLRKQFTPGCFTQF